MVAIPHVVGWQIGAPEIRVRVVQIPCLAARSGPGGTHQLKTRCHALSCRLGLGSCRAAALASVCILPTSLGLQIYVLRFCF